MSYAWLTFAQAKAELANRLNDSNFVTPTEAGLYIGLGMQFFNCITGFWVNEYALTLTPPLATNWQQANGAGSPRLQTQTDLSLYTLIQYMLLEPPTGGGTWTGTPQFNLAMLSQAVQGRRDEALQIGATNIVEVVLPTTPNTDRVTLPDNVLDVRRVRYVSVDSSPTGHVSVLQRGDAESFRTFTPAYLQTTQTPLRWDVISGPPLALTLDTNVPVPATLQCLVMQSEAVPAPPSATPLGIPDDWAWVPLFGALYDLLSSQEESLDTPRAKYCEQRYTEGLKMLKSAPWLLEARLNNAPVSISPVNAADRFNYNWQSDPTAFQQVVEGGMDIFAIAPQPTTKVGVTLVVVGNAPVPTADNQEIQVPRDVMDAILDYAEHLAQFKRGGSEFTQSLDLYKSFLQTAQRWNSRIRASGIFPTTLRTEQPRDEIQAPRFTEAK